MKTILNPTSEHLILRKTLREFIKNEVEPQALWHDRNEKFNLSLFKKLGSMGFLGLTTQMDATASCLAHEELSTSDPGLCLSYLAHSILCVHNLDQNGSQKQKAYFLPRLCSGEWMGAMAMSEAGAGTDVFSMETTARKKGDFYILNGRKMWITNGVLDENHQLVNVCLVYTRLEGSKDISLFVVERGFEGFKAGQVIKDKTGMRSSLTAELIFDNCKVPKSHLIGKEGQAHFCMMRNLEIERLTLAAMSLGIAKRALNEMNSYATQRHAFQKPIRSFGQIQRYLAESYAEFQMCRTYIYSIAQNLDFQKGNQRLESDSAKLIASKIGKKIADRAIQVLGGYGYVGEYCVERLWRDSKLLEIGGGTLEALQKNITKELEKRSEI